MPHKITLFPLGNADCCRIDLDSGTKLLFDFAATRDPEADNDPRCDLPKELRDDLQAAGRDEIDVFALTHLDRDHYQGATEFFWLEHAKKYQGKDRIKIKELWVPAAIITEEEVDADEGCILQREARHRFKEGKGIRVFSRPERLRAWCKKNEVDFEQRTHLITDAGQLVPGFSKEDDGVEFFVHSPFAKRLNESEVEVRNEDALIVQGTFLVQGTETKVLLLGDATHGIITDIVEVTRDKKDRPERLAWDIMKLPHHCSYLSVGPEKGEDQTEPVEAVAWLYETQAQPNAIIVSTSKPIPTKGTAEDDDVQPPHRQAANYYKNTLDNPDDFKVTMEHPSKSTPRPLVIEISVHKATIKKSSGSSGGAATGRSAPRAG